MAWPGSARIRSPRGVRRDLWVGFSPNGMGPIAANGLPTLVVSGGWSPAFDAVCHALVSNLGSDFVVLAGSGHNAQSAPGFNDALAGFLDRVESKLS